MHNPDLPPEIAARLAGYRAQIDAIDNQLIALLKERIGIVAQVGKMKREESPLRNFIRSGREAVMVKRIYREFQGTDFLPEAAAQIWRLLIAASIHHEAPLTLALTPEFSAVAGEYFGSFMPQVLSADAKEALRRAAADKQTIALIPACSTTPPSRLTRGSLDARVKPEQGDEGIELLAGQEFRSLKIFALLPFIPSPNPRVLAYAVAQLIPEETGEDISVFHLSPRERSASDCEQGEGVSRPHPSRAAPSPTSPGGRGSIVEMPGYHTKLPLENAAWLGSYARPIA